MIPSHRDIDYKEVPSYTTQGWVYQTSTMENMAQSMSTVFNSLNTIYKDLGHLWISREKIEIFHLAVLPKRSEFLFNVYSMSNNSDVDLLKNYASQKNIIKSYNCSLCAIKDPKNAIKILDKQQTLSIKTISSNGRYLPYNSPTSRVNYTFKGIGRKIYTYTISGNIPQYYYNHVMLTSEEHIPSYSIFTNPELFNDILYFLKLTTVNMKEIVYGYLNGNFGSDTSHFHIHLTYGTNYICKKIIELTDEDGEQHINTLYYGNVPSSDEKLFKGILFSSYNINFLFHQVKSNFVEIIKKYNLGHNDTHHITGTFFATSNKYYVIIQITIKDNNVFNYVANGVTSQFILFPTSLILLVPENFEEIKPKQQNQYDEFKKQLLTHYSNYFIKFIPRKYTDDANIRFFDIFCSNLNVNNAYLFNYHWFLNLLLFELHHQLQTILLYHFLQ